MTGQRVMVLRPEPGALETAARLRDLGFAPAILPLSEIRPVASVVKIDPVAVACVAATSVNALRHASLTVLERLRDKPLFAVGAATAQAALGAGFSNVRVGSDDGTALAQMILQSMPDAAVLYLCGRVRRPEFEHGLRTGGAAVVSVEVYDTVALDQSAAFTAITSGQPPLVAMCHSPEAARMLADLIEGVPGLGERIKVIAISARAAQPLRAIGVAVDVALAPTDQAMLALLK